MSSKPANFITPCRCSPRSMKAVSVPIDSTVPVIRAPGSMGASVRAVVAAEMRSSIATPARAASKSSSRSSSSPARRFGIATSFCTVCTSANDDLEALPPRFSRRPSGRCGAAPPCGAGPAGTGCGTAAGSVEPAACAACGVPAAGGIDTAAGCRPAVAAGAGDEKYSYLAAGLGGFTPGRCVPMAIRR